MSKIFLNMVIHDMRNPTSSIRMGLQQAVIKLKMVFSIEQTVLEFRTKSAQVRQ